jgi:putative transposase
MLRQIAECGVANRPGRIGTRVIKRRCQHYKLMQEPREVLKARLLAEKESQ